LEFVRWMRYMLARWCAVAAHSRGEWKRFVEGDTSLPRGRSPHLKGSNLWRESVRPPGVGALSAAR